MDTHVGRNVGCEGHVPTRTTIGCFNGPPACTVPLTISTVTDCSASPPTRTAITVAMPTCINVPRFTSWAIPPADCSVRPLNLPSCPTNTAHYGSTVRNPKVCYSSCFESIILNFHGQFFFRSDSHYGGLLLDVDMSPHHRPTHHRIPRHQISHGLRS